MQNHMCLIMVENSLYTCNNANKHYKQVAEFAGFFCKIYVVE